jgi:lipopolysaccharide/colanic/teichoic acid biosynthesis glycosyltransferase
MKLKFDIDEELTMGGVGTIPMQVAMRPVVKPKERKGYFFFKRLFDVAASGAAMVVLSPIFLVTALAIKCEDPKGKVIFSQMRVGKDGKQFRMYKFRSMYADAEERLKELQDQNEADGPVFKMKNDPRITKVGHFIRKFSIDELMQLVNVFKGDMSVVGPRPALPKEVDKYDGYAKQRLLVKPGLSCYWQVSGRSNIGFDEWMELDVKYINEMSAFTDMKIILLTIPAVLKGDGAC